MIVAIPFLGAAVLGGVFALGVAVGWARRERVFERAVSQGAEDFLAERENWLS